jgi:hypothetical protein
MPRIDKVAFVLAVSLLGAAPMANAQSQALTAGTSVRLVVPGEPSPVEGVLFSVTPSDWTLSTADGELRTFSSGEVASAEVWSTRRSILKGALIGGGVGLASGLLMSLGVNAVCPGGSDVCGRLEDEFYSLTWARFYTPALGAALGGLIGAFVKTGRWVPVVEPQASQGGSLTALSWTIPVGF